MKNNLLNLFGGAGRMIVFLISIPILIKFMGLEKYGLWVLLTSIGNVAMLLDSGLTGTSMFFVSKSLSLNIEERNKAISSLFVINIAIIIVINVIFVIFASTFNSLFFSELNSESGMIGAIILVGIYTSTLISHNVFIGIIQSYSDFLSVNIVKLLFLIFVNAGVITLVYLEYNFFELTLWMVFCCVFALLFYIWIAFHHLKTKTYNWIFDNENFREVTLYSLNTWLGYASNVLFNQMDKIIVGLITTPYILGAYSAIISITTYINSLATVGLQPLIPEIAKLYTNFNKNKKSIYDKYSFSLEFNTILVFSLGLMMTPFIDYILYGIMDIEPSNLNLSLFFFLAIAIYSINSLYVPGFYALLAIKESRIVGRVQLLSSLFALLLVFFLGKKYGLQGAILGNIGFIVSYYFNFKFSKTLQSNVFTWTKHVKLYILIYLLLIFCYFNFLNYFNAKVLFSILGLLSFGLIFYNRNKIVIKQTFIK